MKGASGEGRGEEAQENLRFAEPKYLFICWGTFAKLLML